MRVLLDTHALLWFLLDDPQLSLAARLLIEDPVANGEHMKEGLYKLIHKSLVYYYSVDEKRRLVIVSAVGVVRS